MFPFTLIVDDPSGNSFVENPHMPKADPHLKISFVFFFFLSSFFSLFSLFFYFFFLSFFLSSSFPPSSSPYFSPSLYIYIAHIYS